MTRSDQLVFVQFALFGVLGLAVVLTPTQSTDTTRLVGFILIGLGIVLIFTAISTFQRVNRTTPNITPMPSKKAKLVTEGVYGRMRHPIYSGVLLTAFGIALAHGNMLMWAIVGAMYIFFYSKSRYEEVLLMNAYPEYKTYMTHTGRFLPRL